MLNPQSYVDGGLLAQLRQLLDKCSRPAMDDKSYISSRLFSNGATNSLKGYVLCLWLCYGDTSYKLCKLIEERLSLYDDQRTTNYYLRLINVVRVLAVLSMRGRRSMLNPAPGSNPNLHLKIDFDMPFHIDRRAS